MSASFPVVIATCLASIFQNIKKISEDSYIRATTMLKSNNSAASNSSGFQLFLGQCQQIRLGGQFNQTIRFKTIR